MESVSVCRESVRKTSCDRSEVLIDGKLGRTVALLQYIFYIGIDDMLEFSQ